MKKALVFERLAARRLVLQNVADQAAYAVGRVLTEGRVKGGWRAYSTPVAEGVVDITVDTGELKEDGTPKTQHKTAVYSFELHVQQKSKRLRREDVVAEEFEKVSELAAKSLKAKGWTVKEVRDLPEDYVLPGYEDADKEEVKDETSQGEVLSEVVEEVQVEVSPEPTETVEV